MSEQKICDEQYMRRAIELAKRGEGWCHPNPMVGAVIVKDGRIIAEGWHAKYGEKHAERNAIASLKESAAGATLYCTLEPCCHHGKQPPCTEAIIESGIHRVVVGSGDPNPLVAGKGNQILRAAGIEVVEGVLKDECDAVNPVFFHYITAKMPYVIMKYAMTADGKIATVTGASKWISCENSRKRVHDLRHACMGIIAGIGTVLADDPMLNYRTENGRDPIRIICDDSLRIPADSQLVRSAHDIDTYIVSGRKDYDRRKAVELEAAGCRVLIEPGENGRVDINALMRELGERGIDSILVEGGATLNYSILKSGCVNELRVFMAPKIFGGTAKSPVGGEGVTLPSDAWEFVIADIERIDDDVCITYKRKKD